MANVKEKEVWLHVMLTTPLVYSMSSDIVLAKQKLEHGIGKSKLKLEWDISITIRDSLYS